MPNPRMTQKPSESLWLLIPVQPASRFGSIKTFNYWRPAEPGLVPRGTKPGAAPPFGNLPLHCHGFVGRNHFEKISFHSGEPLFDKFFCVLRGAGKIPALQQLNCVSLPDGSTQLLLICLRIDFSCSTRAGWVMIKTAGNGGTTSCKEKNELLAGRVVRHSGSMKWGQGCF